MAGIGIGMCIPFNGRGSRAIPFGSDALFWLDGTIENSGGNYYFVDKKWNRDFLITNYDFDVSIGFPYKSNATISAPAGDAVLIASDVNGFLYTGGVPNQIPVCSLFQDIDYEHRLFCRHAAQVVDGDLIETYEPRVLDIVLYANAKTGTDLTACQTYYSVPTESGTAGWVSKTGNDTTGDGTKTKPFLSIDKAIKTLAAGYVIYIKTGIYDESSYANGPLNFAKNGTIKGIGLTEVTCSSTAAQVMDINNVSETIEGIIINAESARNNCMIFRGNGDEANILRRCVFKNSNAASFTISGTVLSTTITNCVIVSGTVGSTNFYGLTLDTNYVSTHLFNIPATSSSPTIKNNKLIGGGFGVYNNNLTFLGNTCSIVTGDYVDYGGTAATAQRVWTIKGNTFRYSNITNTTYCIDIRTVNYELEATYNEFYYLSTNAIANVGAFIYTHNINRSVIEHNTFINRSKSQFFLARNSIDGSLVPSTPYKMNYNYCESDMLTGTMLAVGEEIVFANILDDSEIIGNVCIGYKRNYPAETGTIHPIFANNGENMDIKYNYVSHAFYGLCIKAGADESGYTSRGICYNVIEDCSQGILIKGINGANVFNNTIYHSATVYTDDFETCFTCIINNGDQRVENIVFKNNITISKRNVGELYDLQTAADTSTITNAIVNGGNGIVDAMNFADAVTAGYLADSTESDVVFHDANNHSFYPTTAQVGGYDNGAAYDDGLDVSTDFGSSTEDINIVTKQQIAWQIGAYVI